MNDADESCDFYDPYESYITYEIFVNRLIIEIIEFFVFTFFTFYGMLSANLKKGVIRVALPEGMKLIQDANEKPFITLRNLYITFSKFAVEQLDNPAFVHMYIDTDKKMVAFQSCEKDSAAIPFYKKPEEGKQSLVRITGKRNATRLMELASVSDCGKGIRFYGDYLPEDHAIIFDMTIRNDE